MVIGDSEQLTATVSPADADNKSIVWSSIHEDVAAVSNSGKVVALKEGHTVVVAKASNGISSVCEVDVYGQPVPLQYVKLASRSLDVSQFGSDTLSYTFLPENATEKVSWSSSNDTIAVILDGVVYARNVGEVTVYAQGKDGILFDSCVVTVVPHVCPLEKLELSKHEITLYEKDSETLEYILTPQNTTDSIIQWVSDDSLVAIVTNGTVTALRAGNTLVHAIGAGGSVVDKCEVTVLCKVAGVKLSEHEELCETGRTISMSASVYPSRAENRQINWSSTNEQVATVNQGIVTCRTAGETYIVVSTVNGEFSDSCLLTVVNPVSGLSMDSTNVSMFEGDVIELKALVKPQDAKDTEINWVSSNPEVADVDAQGHVQALIAGQTTIVAVTREGGYVATCQVCVYKHVSEIRFDLETDTVALYKGESLSLVPIVLPYEAPNKELVWSSSNTGAVTVDQSGRITAVGQGTAVITATSKDNKDVSADVIVRVKKHVEKVEVAAVSPIYEGTSQKLTVNVYPADADDKVLSYSSDNDGVVTVDAYGVIHAVRAGTANIRIESHDGGKTAQCEVTVLCHVSEIEFDEESIIGFVGSEIQLEAKVLPERASDQTVTWESSNDDVAIISKNGKLRLWAQGETDIKVTSTDNPNAWAVLHVKVLVHSESVSLDKSDANLFEGESVQLNATIRPYDDPALVKWTSSNESIATVSDSGLVTAKKLGQVTIKAQANDNPDNYAICTVNVKKHVTGVSISPVYDIYIFKGTTQKINATVSPSNASDKSVVWSSSDDKIASVDENGIVKGLGKGQVIITVKTNDLGFTATKTINVVPCIDKVEVSPSSRYMDQYSEGVLTWYKSDGEIPMQVTISPSDFENQNVSWRSSDSKVIEVNDDGQIIPKSVGTAILTVTTEGVMSNNEYAKASITVRVIDHVESVSLSVSELSLCEGETFTLVPTISPETADNSVLWGTSDETVARVDGGKITAVSPGTAIISVVSVDGFKKATCLVNVRKAITSVTSISFSNSSLTLEKGSSTQLVPSIFPTDATYKELHWEVSDPNVIELLNNDASQISIKAVDYGTVTVTATAVKDGSGVSAQCTINVPEPNKVKTIEINPGTLTLVEKETATIIASVLPSNAADKTVTWTSSDPSVATVTASGSSATVKAVLRGTATIKATANDGSGIIGECEVVVTEKVLVESISVFENGKELEGTVMYVGDTYVIPEPQISPDDATNTTLDYKVESGAYITFDKSSRTITAQKAGGPWGITIRANDGSGKYCQFLVTVKNRSVEFVTLDKGSMTVKPGKTFTLTPSVYPANATDKTVKWKSSDTSVATVSSKGVVTAKGEGKATITVTTNDGSKEAYCEVTVDNVSTMEDVIFDDWN